MREKSPSSPAQRADRAAATPIRLAEEGADIIAVDLCEDVDTIGYPLATPEDLDETAELRREDRPPRVHGARPTSGGSAAASSALEDGIAELGKVDIVVAQAGVAGMKGQPPMQAWTDVINTNLIGTINAIQVALPHLKEGASIVATGSTAALMDAHNKPNPGGDPGGMAYMTSTRRALSEYVHDLATELAVRGIRANVVHPTNCNTDMLQSEPMYRSFRPDLENPTRADAEPVFGVQQAMKVNFIEPEDISNAVSVAGLRRGPLRHRHAAARRRGRLPEVVRLPRGHQEEETA